MKSSNIILMLTILSMCSISLAQDSPQDYLDEHNKARKEVGVGPLIWDDLLVEYAQKYADSKIGTCEMVHSYGPFGENIAAGSGNLSARDAVKAWNAEKSNYDYKNNKCVNGECGHYTQVIWSTTFNVGCGKVKCKNGWTYVVCSYDPPGNIMGIKPY